MCETCGDTHHQPLLSRRDFLKTGALAALAPWSMNVAFAADPPAPGAPPPPNAIAPADALKRLLEGNARYASNSPNERDFSSGRAARVQGQYPIASILSCADSRVAPELAFDQGPGDLFVMRVAGNVVTPDLLASLEYGVQFLGVPLIMVLGHTGCGAIVAAKTQTGKLPDNAVAENVRRQVSRLKNSPPIVQKAYAGKKIDIVGGVY